MAVGGLSVAILMLVSVLCSFGAWATDSEFQMQVSEITMSPMNQKVVLVPGEVYEGSFRILNSSATKEAIHYSITMSPFYVDDAYVTVFEEKGNTGKIVDWTTLEVPSEGELAVGEKKDIQFKINVPTEATLGGQYLAFRVLVSPNEDDEGGVEIEQMLEIGHLVFAEVGDGLMRRGEVVKMQGSGFLTSDKIFGKAVVRNTGEVHGVAKYTLKVSELLTGKEVYSNIDQPLERTILPERELEGEVVWEETPNFGLYQAVFEVEFEGVHEEISRVVFVCPTGVLIALILVIIVAVVFII